MKIKPNPKPAGPDLRAVITQAEQALAHASHVVVTGPISRTWYKDQAQLVEVFMWLDELKFVPIVIASTAFAITATAASKITGIRIELIDDKSVKVATALRDAGLLVVLTPRTTPNIEAASPFVAVAREQGIPVLGLCPDGAAVYHDD